MHINGPRIGISFNYGTFSKPGIMRNKPIMSLGMEIFVDEIIKSIEKSEGNMMTKVIVIYVYKRKYLLIS